MKDFAMNTQRSSAVATLRSRSTSIASTIALSVAAFAVVSQPLHAQPLSRTERTEESEKCEWLGVCESASNTEESDRCVWLGICD